MKKRQQEEQYGFNYDEDGVNQVSAQIMDSYNSGIIDESEMARDQSQEKSDF
jgi:hypothetical protein